MGRRYKVTFDDVVVSQAQDLVQITGATGKLIRIHRLWVGNSVDSLPAGQSLRLRGRTLPGTVTVGSGGTTGITPSKTDPGDAACSSTTCATNNTTPASTNGTAVVQYARGVHLYNGEDWTFPEPPVVGATSAFVFELLNAPSGTVKMSGGVDLEEIG